MATLQLIFLLGVIVAMAKAQCPSPYLQLNPSHTMCLRDKGTNRLLNASEIQAILDAHNVWRQNVTPKAANMQKLIWDSNLARVASKWSRQCMVKHDEYSQRAEPTLPGVLIGQNAAGGYSSMKAAVAGWGSEIKNFAYGVQPRNVVGHYTQIVFANTVRVGCGEADCSGVSGAFKKVQICNYAIGQNGNDVYTAPYKSSSTSCSDCSTKCDASGTLCDCGGKVCHNGGRLAVATCTCTCTRGYKGDLCQTKNCPGQDTSRCSRWLTHFASQNVDGCQYVNVKKEVCPYRCGFCP